MKAELIGSVDVDGAAGSEEIVVVAEVGGNRCMTAHTDEAVEVVARDFGANVDGMDPEDVATWIWRNRGKEIEVDPDFWVGCPTKQEVAERWPKADFGF